jgi:hypothetical protein
MASGGALGRELASDWPPEGMTRPGKDRAGESVLQTPATLLAEVT